MTIYLSYEPTDLQARGLALRTAVIGRFHGIRIRLPSDACISPDLKPVWNGAVYRHNADDAIDGADLIVMIAFESIGTFLWYELILTSLRKKKLGLSIPVLVITPSGYGSGLPPDLVTVLSVPTEDTAEEMLRLPDISKIITDKLIAAWLTTVACMMILQILQPGEESE